MNTTKTNDGHGALPRHLDDSDLISYLDGESTREEQDHARAHLESCWHCRSQLASVETSIEAFLRVRKQVLPEEIPPANVTLAQFRQRLTQHNNAPVSFSVRLLRAINSNRFSHRAATPKRELGVDQAANWEGHKRNAAPLFCWASWLAVFTMGHRKSVLATILIVTTAGVFLVDPFNWTRVSADDLLNRAGTYEFLNATSSGKVIRARVRIDRIALSTNSEKKIAEIETDKDSASYKVLVSTEDVSGAIYKEVVEDGDNLSSISGFGSELSSTTAKYLESQQWFPQVTVASYKKLLAGRGLNGNDGAFVVLRSNSYELHHPFVPSHASGITETVLQLNSQDYAPQRISIFTSESDDRFEYRLTRTSFELLDRTPAVARLFEPASSEAAVPIPITKSAIDNRKSEILSGLPVPASPIVASADLEVEVLRLLSEARADLGEQVSAIRGDDGLIHVTGIVDTPERKAELLQAMKSLADNPAVRIDIQTVSEGVAQQQQQRRSRARATPGPITQERVEINSEALPVASELRPHFSSDEEMRQFAARVVSDSRNAMRHVYAMKRLTAQFSVDQLRALTPEAKAKWAAMISSHARAFQNQSEALRRQLQSIFRAGSAGAGSAGVSSAPVADDASLIRAVDRLFANASSNDAMIRSAFSSSSETTTSTAVGSAQFWQSMRSAEALATTIAAVQGH
jgi:hypothetical protein